MLCAHTSLTLAFKECSVGATASGLALILILETNLMAQITKVTHVLCCCALPPSSRKRELKLLQKIDLQ